jgi:FdhD protein
MTEAAILMPHLRWTAGRGAETGERMTAEETAVALVHDGSTTAVMMATPADLEDFGLGFSLSEGIVERPGDIRDLEVATTELGIEVRSWLETACGSRLAARRRRLAGATGCGLCGIESLAEAARPPRQVEDVAFAVGPEELLSAMEALVAVQRLGEATRAVHAAGFWLQGGELTVREDVGRHNALDKLVGALARRGGGRAGVLLLTSRVSVEMVQKAAVLGAPVLCAVSAPTALAVRLADAAGITLVAVARRDGLEVFTHAERVIFPKRQ